LAWCTACQFLYTLEVQHDMNGSAQCVDDPPRHGWQGWGDLTRVPADGADNQLTQLTSTECHGSSSPLLCNKHTDSSHNLSVDYPLEQSLLKACQLPSPKSQHKHKHCRASWVTNCFLPARSSWPLLVLGNVDQH